MRRSFADISNYTNYIKHNSNYIINLLAKIAEKTSGKSFEELSEELFKTCNKNNTFHPNIKYYKNLVKGYNENEDGKFEKYCERKTTRIKLMFMKNTP